MKTERREPRIHPAVGQARRVNYGERRKRSNRRRRWRKLWLSTQRRDARISRYHEHTGSRKNAARRGDEENEVMVIEEEGMRVRRRKRRFLQTLVRLTCDKDLKPKNATTRQTKVDCTRLLFFFYTAPLIYSITDIYT